VVASHGGDEERVLTAALRAGVPYVGLIASPRRGRAVLSALSDPAADRVHTPAGLDIGARTPHEIAVSVYAELIATHMRRPGLGAEFRETEAPSTVDLRDHTPGSGLARVPGTPAAGEIVEAVDPVCGMTVAVSPVTPRADHGGRRYHFCCTGCADRFRADPTRYVSTSETHAP
jgi:xanthine dehydrogenase accessory factor